MNILIIILTYILAYVIGSIPFAIVIGKGLFGVDVRKEGSGNTGATNVLRVLGWGPGLIVCALDVLKGVFAPFIMTVVLNHVAPGYSETTNQILIAACALVAIIGHSISPFLNFSGGKGVATTWGTLMYLVPLTAIFAFLTFLVVVFISRYVSLGSMSAAISLGIWTLVWYPSATVYIIYGLIAGLLVIFYHRENIKALFEHRERKFSVGKRENHDSSDAQ